MSNFDDEVSNKILKKRNIKPSSLKAYLLNLQKLMKLSEIQPSVDNLDSLLKKPENIEKLLHDKKSSTIRNYIASIVVYLGIDEKNEKLLTEYRQLMDKYQKANNETIENNKKSDTQSKNWATMAELKTVLKNYKKQIDMNGILKKDELNKKEFDLLQKWVVGSLYIADPENLPLRNDYIMEIISDSDYKRLTEAQKKEQNYLVIKNKNNKYFSLGEYKTSDKYGIREIKVGKILNKIINTWLKYNKSKHLILNSKGDPINANSLTKLLIKIFEPTGKKISSSMIRHIYITERFPPNTQEKKEVAEAMLHSKNIQSNIYAKED